VAAHPDEVAVTNGEFRIQLHSADSASRLAAELVDVHVDARADLIREPFYSPEQFAHRLTEHLAEPNYALAAGHLDDHLVAFAYGASMPADTWWWQHLEGVQDPAVAVETGNRTFWLRELVVRAEHQGHGYAHRLHDALLQPRPEERAALFVRKDSVTRKMYERWGWFTVGHLPSLNGSPEFDAMLLLLHAGRPESAPAD
jgi:GNAT superfamily N-acetyltransferase